MSTNAGDNKIILDETEMDVSLPKNFRGWTIEEVRRVMQDKLFKGTNCPCCGQHAKIYKRRLNSGMVASLIWLVLKYEETGDWVEPQKTAPRYVLANREMGKLLHWSLVDIKENDDTSRRTSGLWMPTPLGVDFAKNNVFISTYVYLYTNDVVGFSQITTNAREALGKKFNYDELMNNI